MDVIVQPTQRVKSIGFIVSCLSIIGTFERRKCPVKDATVHWD